MDHGCQAETPDVNHYHAHCILVLALSRKNNTVKHWMEQRFTDIDKKEQDQLQKWALVPLGNHSRAICLHAPLISLEGIDKILGLTKCYTMCMLKQNKAVTLSLKQGKIFPHQAISMA